MSESRKRHEILSRRPSYRKILDELQGQGSKLGDSPILPKVEEEARASPDGECGRTTHSTLLHSNGGNPAAAGQPLLIPATSAAVAHHLLQPPPAPIAGNNSHPLHAAIGVTATGSASEDDEGSSTPSSGHHSLSHTAAMTPNAQHGSTLVQYGGVDSQFYLPVSDLQNLSAYHLPGGTRNHPNNSLPGAVVNNLIDSNRMGEESTRKREMRLLKNREAARECRRKKKDYVKCLENRVAVLENQNKALIEELKSLKDLYCNKQD